MSLLRLAGRRGVDQFGQAGEHVGVGLREHAVAEVEHVPLGGAARAQDRQRPLLDDLPRRQDILARELERRLLNGLELIARLLSSQSQAATTPEAAAQLGVAARRITAIGRS